MQRKNGNRKEELARKFFSIIDQHLQDLLEEKTSRMMELKEIAGQLYCSQKYLIEIFNELYGLHPGHFYVQKILDECKRLLRETSIPVAQIANRLTYDRSNFNKFFKKYVGQTPGQFRAGHQHF